MASVMRFEVKIVFFLGLALLSCDAHRGPADNGAAAFDVTKFGAKADGKTECAQGFIRAWNAACHSNGEAKVLVPPGTYMTGEVFFQGPCSSQVTVEVQGTVLAQADLSEYHDNQWFSIQNVNGLVLTGGGTFNGQGEAAWQYNSCGGQAECDFPLPASLVFDGVSNAALEGITLVNSKGTNVKISGCQNFRVQNVHITAPWDSPNTDGIHIARSDEIFVSSCSIATGADCIAVGEGVTKNLNSLINCHPGHLVRSLNKVLFQ